MRWQWARWFALALAVVAPLRAASWIELRHGPFIVYSDAGSEAAQTALNQLEQLRYAVGEAVGKREATLAWPVEVVVRKAGAEGKNAAPALSAPLFAMSRAGYMMYLRAGEQPPESILRALGQTILEHNVARPMTAGFEHAIVSLYATMRVEGQRWVVGAPPIQAERTEEWAIVHRLAVVDETSSRVHVFFSNLANGAEEEIAWRNVYGSRMDGHRYTPEQRKLAREYLQAGQFTTRLVPARYIMTRDMHEVPALPGRIRLLPGDLALARQMPVATVRSMYETALNEKASPAGHEGRALTLLLEHRTDDAKKELEDAIWQEGASARAYFELSRLEKDKTRSEKLMEHAVKLNPLWADPFIELAHREPGPVRRAFHLKKATELRPRDAALWEELARAQLDAGQLDSAERSMRVALDDTPEEAARERLKQRFDAFQQERADKQAAARQKERDEAAAELERVRQEQLARIHEAEKKANAKAGARTSDAAPMDWQDGPPTKSVTGVLKQVECLGKAARLLIVADGKSVRVAVADPKQLALQDATGAPAGAETSFACGVQRKPRTVKVDYTERKTAMSIGDAVILQFLDK